MTRVGLQRNRKKNIFYKTKLHGLSPRTNYTDRAAAAGRRSFIISAKYVALLNVI
jgi:hypothetical protein